IVVGEIRDSRPDMMVQEAIRRALEERGVKAIVHTIWDVLGLSEQEYAELRNGMRNYTIFDGQRELETFFTLTGLMQEPQKGRDWVRQQDADLYNATWPQPKIDNPRLAALARDYTDSVQNALVKWLDNHPEVDWVVW